MIYLSAYRSTPHSTTGLAPGNVFRGRNRKTKIPELTQSIGLTDEEMRDLDRYKKYGYKQYADKKRHAKVSEIQPGDKVLVRQRKENKLTTPFSPIEHTVVWKSGNSVAAQSPEGKIVRRNSSHFQPVKERDLGRFDTSNTSPGYENVRNEVQSEEPEATLNEIPNQSDLTDSLSRTKTLPQRQRQTPLKYKDFVLGLIIETMES